jgi:hypothetical protein
VRIPELVLHLEGHEAAEPGKRAGAAKETPAQEEAGNHFQSLRLGQFCYPSDIKLRFYVHGKTLLKSQHTDKASGARIMGSW